MKQVEGSRQVVLDAFCASSTEWGFVLAGILNLFCLAWARGYRACFSIVACRSENSIGLFSVFIPPLLSRTLATRLHLFYIFNVL